MGNGDNGSVAVGNLILRVQYLLAVDQEIIAIGIGRQIKGDGPDSVAMFGHALFAASPGKEGAAAKRTKEVEPRSNTPFDADNQESLFTATPIGRRWQVKAISPAGDVTFLGRFDGRLAALGAALLLATHARGRAVP